MDTCTIDGHNIQYYKVLDHGDPVVVFVNGLTQNRTQWRGFQDFLSGAGISSVAFDLPGQGGSEPSKKEMNFESTSRILNGLIQHLAITQPVLCGLSLGAIVALKFCIHHPTIPAGLISMAGLSERDQLHLALHRAMEDATKHRGVAYLWDLVAGLNYSHNWFIDNAKPLKSMRLMAAANNKKEVMLDYIRLLQTFENFTPELNRIKCPTLLLAGDKDVLTPRWCQEILVNHISNARLLLLQNLGHAFILESMRMTRSIISDFVMQVKTQTWKGHQEIYAVEECDEHHFKLQRCRRKFKRGNNEILDISKMKTAE